MATSQYVNENGYGDDGYTEDGTVDLKGNPILRSKTGGWKACSFIVVYEVFERMAYYGISSNLVIYLTDKLHQGTVKSSNNVTNWVGTIWMTPILGAYFADAYLGRFWTFLIASAIYLLKLSSLGLLGSFFTEGVVEKFAAEVKQTRQGEDSTVCFCTMLVNVVKEVVLRYRIAWDIGKINKRIKNLTESLRTYGIIHGINEGEITSFRQVILQSGAIGVERWGGSGGGHWSYRPKGLVKHIVVKHGVVIDSIMFKSIEENGILESSQIFGGSGGNCTEINIDTPSEYLIGISGTFGLFGPYTLIKSLKFHTNLSHHGPMGAVEETDTNFSFIMQGGVVVGFHGFSGLFLDAIGLYVMPARISLLS